MQEFTATELANNTGDVLMAAAGAAVQITRHGKPQFVLMTQAQYSRLLEQNGIETEPKAPKAAPPKSPPKTPVAAKPTKPAKKASKKVRRKKKNNQDNTQADANAALELMQALQSWGDD